MLELDTMKWAHQQFGTCELGDKRRTKRAVRYAADVAADPDSSTPQQSEKWSDLKATYRLFDTAEVTFRGLAEPHWRQTRESFAGRGHILLIDDTTDVCFNNRKKLHGLGTIQSDKNQGFLLHSSLGIDAANGEVLGMAGQTIRHREPVKKQHARQRLKRADRESRLWGDVIDLVGTPATGATYTHVCDRGADNFEVYCHLIQQHSGWVIRAAQLTRKVVDREAARWQIKKLLESLPLAGSYELEVRASAKQPARTARLEVRYASIQMPRPAMTSPYVKQCGIGEIPMYVVEVREVNPTGAMWPNGFQPLHWVLYTSHPVENLDQSCGVVEMYEKRPLIEEYHKALKTGCRLESRQYENAHRLEAVTGILAVVAVRLLQLKTVAKREPERPACDVVPQKWVEMLQVVRKRPITTVRQFFREMAGLGGFLGRKGDGEPGWITLWRGFEKLHLLLRGAEAARRRCG